MTALLIASLLTVKFPGGNANEFAAILVGATKQNVVISQSEPKLIPKAEFATEDLNEMARSLRAQTQHIILPGADLVISDQLIPPRLVNERGRRQFRRAERGQVEVSLEAPTQNIIAVNLISLPATAVHNGMVTFKTEKSDALQSGSLGAFSRPVKSHWYFQQIPIFVSVTDMPEADFLKWAAKAVGGRLLVTEKEYMIDIDPVEVRRRVIATIQKQVLPAANTPEGAMELKERNFRIAGINALSAAQISETLKTPGGQSKIALSPRSPLAKLALQRLRDLAQSAASSEGRSRESISAVGALQRIDNSRTASLIVNARFDVEVEVPILDRNGRPAGFVRL
jgi:hypothetical protein